MPNGIRYRYRIGYANINNSHCGNNVSETHDFFKIIIIVNRNPFLFAFNKDLKVQLHMT